MDACLMKLDRIEVSYDFDGYCWVRTAEGELCGPYDSIADAVEDGVA